MKDEDGRCGMRIYKNPWVTRESYEIGGNYERLYN